MAEHPDPASLFFVLVAPARKCLVALMLASYGHLCPVAKASEIFATRWTRPVLRELIAGEHTFNGIHRGVPLMSRAVLVARLRELEEQGLLEWRPRGGGTGVSIGLRRPVTRYAPLWTRSVIGI